MLAALRQRNFALLWFGRLVSLLGDWVLFAGLPFYVYTLTGSALATGGMFIAFMLPRLLLGSLAGVFVDRWDRRRTMIVADLSRAVLLLLLLVARTPQLVWIVYLSVMIESAISQFFSPANSALLPRLVGEEHLMTANSLNAIAEQITRLVGAAFGGLLMGLLGMSSVVFVDSASFLISGVCIFFISVPKSTAEKVADTSQKAPGQAWLAIWREWLEGLALLKKNRLVASIFLVMAVAMVAEGIIEVLYAPFVKVVLQSGAMEFGWLLSLQAVGGIIGGLVMGRVGRGISPARLISSSGVAFGLIDLIVFNAGSLPIAMVLIALAGIPVVGFFTGLYTLLQGNVEDGFRGRIFGAYGTANALLALCGLGLASALTDLAGIVPMLNLVGMLEICAGLLAAVMLRGALVLTPAAKEA